MIKCGHLHKAGISAHFILDHTAMLKRTRGKKDISNYVKEAIVATKQPNKNDKVGF